MLSENRKLVYAGNRYNDIHYRSLSEIHFTASGFFGPFVVSFWSFFFFFFFFFFCVSTHYEKQKKIKITIIYKPVEQTHYCVDLFFQIIT